MAKRHKHTLSYYRLLTGDMGLLYPVGLTEALPGDTFQHNASVFLRMSPMAAPVMHPITVRVHHFFVPHRLVWPTEGQSPNQTGWEMFITGGENGTDAQTIPTINTTGAANDLFDYFALPRVADIPVSALPIRCYNLIYNEFFRDEDLIPKEALDDVKIKKIAWEKDYWTMARPTSQKGPGITLPIGGVAPVRGIGKTDQTYADNNVSVYESGQSDPNTFASAHNMQTSMYVEQDPNNTGFPGIYADLAAAQAVDVNDFRRAFALQRYAEARQRYGSRYVEYLRYIGAHPSDARLQRPEMLGGGKVRLSTSEVLQTANEATPGRFGVGDLYGHGVAAMRSNAYRRTFNEHGYVMSLLSVRPKAMYLNGVERTWMRRDRNEFWQKELEQIGQQEVWNGEVWVTAGDQNDGSYYGTFGYQDRFREYRESQNKVTGEFRNVLNYWHLGREFTQRPVLNASFVECDPSKRIFNVQGQHGLWMAVQHRLVARRLLRKRATARIL